MKRKFGQLTTRFRNRTAFAAFVHAFFVPQTGKTTFRDHALRSFEPMLLDAEGARQTAFRRSGA
jgi:hypothetical protein